MANPKKYTKSKLNKFRKLIEKEIETVHQDIDELKEGVIDSGNASESNVPDSVYSVHMADAGTDSHEKEKNFQFMVRENSYYQNLVSALKRIDNGTYGICKQCAEEPKNLCSTCPLIPEDRLMAVPIATMCVECKEKDKMGLL
jgi:RNA polymerase-binding transcription factor DksA